MKYFEAKSIKSTVDSPSQDPEILQPEENDDLWPLEPSNGEAPEKPHLTARETSLLNLSSEWLADVLSATRTSKPLQKPDLMSLAPVILNGAATDNNFSMKF
jgi:hypothetical protein